MDELRVRWRGEVLIAMVERSALLWESKGSRQHVLFLPFSAGGGFDAGDWCLRSSSSFPVRFSHSTPDLKPSFKISFSSHEVF